MADLTRRTALVGALAALTGCGVPPAYIAADRRAGTDRSATDKRIDFANWPLYIDVDENHPLRRPTLEEFQKHTGIRTHYAEEINDNSEFFGKLGPTLMNHHDPLRDLIVVVVPEEGAELWADSLMIPNLAEHKRDAERLVDYYYEPEVAAELAWVNYVCPVPAAREVLASSKDKDTAALAEDPLIFPDASMRGRLFIARDITAAERPELEKEWEKLVGR
jgi:spermidine/putrescine-binding protein